MTYRRTMRQRPTSVSVEPKPSKGRVPPHDLDAEGAVLAAVLLEREALDRVLEILKPEHFYSDANRRIFDACVQLTTSGTPVDITTVASWLRSREWINQVGGSSYLVQLVDQTPSISHVAAHAKVVFEKWRLRQVIGACQRIAAEGYGDVGDVQEFLAAAEHSIFQIARDPASTKKDPALVKAIFTEVIQTIHDNANRGVAFSGVATGLHKLDERLAGMQYGDLIVVAARPGLGKTSFAMNVAINVVAPYEPTDIAHGVVVFSLEMPREQLVQRMACSESGIDVTKLRRPNTITPEDWQRLTETGSSLSSGPIGWPLWIDDTPAINMLELRAKLRRIISEYNKPKNDNAREQRVSVVVVDYIQLMKGREGVDNREQEISEITRGLKALAKEFGVVVIALSQLNRAVETRSKDAKSKKPQLSDLRECIAGDQVVIDVNTGKRHYMRDLVDHASDVMVTGYDQSTRALVPTTVGYAWATGLREMRLVTVASGETLRCTPEHRLLTLDGWRTVCELGAGDKLAMASHGYDLRYESIVSICEDGVDECFDLCMPQTNSFVVNGFVAHNSGAIEQDADTILFPWRESYYNPECASPHIAEINVAKQRNGATGVIYVKWTARCTRFDNLDPSEYPKDDAA